MSSGSSLKLHEVVERIITGLLYKKKTVAEESDDVVKRVGLQSPIWWWTHRCLGTNLAPPSLPAAAEQQQSSLLSLARREAMMLYHALEWFTFVQVVPMQKVLVVSMPDVITELHTLIHSPAHYRGAGRHHHHHHKSSQEQNNNVSQSNFRALGGARIMSLPQYAAAKGRTGKEEEEEKKVRNTKFHPHLPSSQKREEREKMKEEKENQKIESTILLFSFGTLGTNANIKLMQEGKEGVLSSLFLDCAKEVLLIISDVGWTHGQTPWRTLNQSVGKFREEKLTIVPANAETGDAAIQLHGLVGSRLLVACPFHPKERSFVSGLERIAGFCPRICFKPYQCSNHRKIRMLMNMSSADGDDSSALQHHYCTSPCHPSYPHRAGNCPYACTMTLLACGHECQMGCSQPCNCLQVTEKILPCSHERVVGIEPNTLEPLTETVQHCFQGVCAHMDIPCGILVPVTCTTCNTIIEMPCSNYQALYVEKNESVICEDCQALRLKIRAEIRMELVKNLRQQKEERKMELKKQWHEQGKAAQRGVFHEGQKVIIADPEAIRPPMEDDFPQVSHWAPTESTIGIEDEQGTVLDRLVDITDQAEILYLVKLTSTGYHILIADYGLQLMKALTGTGVSTTAAPLMLTAGPTGQSATTTEQHQAVDTSSLPNIGTNVLLVERVQVSSGLEESGAEEEVGKAESISSGDDGESSSISSEEENVTAHITLCNVFVKVTQHIVENGTVQLEVEYTQSILSIASSQGGGPVSCHSPLQEGESQRKRQKLEDGHSQHHLEGEHQLSGGRTNPSFHSPMFSSQLKTFRFRVFPQQVESIFNLGEVVRLNNPLKQIFQYAEKKMLEVPALECCSNEDESTMMNDKKRALCPARISAQERCKLIGFFNPPTTEQEAQMDSQMFSTSSLTTTSIHASSSSTSLKHRLEKLKGPFAVLEPEFESLSTTSKSGRYRGRGRGGGLRRQNNNNGHSSWTDTVVAVTTQPQHRVVIVPYHFISPDEEAQAEAELEAALYQQLEMQSEERFNAISEETVLKNEEKRLHKLQLMMATSGSAQQTQGAGGGGLSPMQQGGGNNGPVAFHIPVRLLDAQTKAKMLADHSHRKQAQQSPDVLTDTKKMDLLKARKKQVLEAKDCAQYVEVHQREREADRLAVEKLLKGMGVAPTGTLTRPKLPAPRR